MRSAMLEHIWNLQPNSLLLLVVMPVVPSSVLAPSSEARSP